MIVTHKMYGQGKVIDVYGDFIEVDFSGQKKKFNFPHVFDQRILSTKDSALLGKISKALEATERQVHLKVSSSSKVLREISELSASFIGSASQSLQFKDDNELFEVVGYLAKPGRINSIWAEIPNDHREVEFNMYFPGQPYLPITQGETFSGKPKKFGSQFRINMANISNCPNVLKSALGKGLSKSIVARINKSKFVVQLVQYFGFQFGDEQDVLRIKRIAIDYGYLDAFNKGYNR